MDIKPVRVEINRLVLPDEELEIERLAARLQRKMGTMYEPSVSVRDKDGHLLVEDPEHQRIVRAWRFLYERTPPEEKARYAKIGTRHQGLWYPDLEDYPSGTSLQTWESGWVLLDSKGHVLERGGKPRPEPPAKTSHTHFNPDDRDDDDDSEWSQGPEIMDPDHYGFDDD